MCSCKHAEWAWFPIRFCKHARSGEGEMSFFAKNADRWQQRPLGNELKPHDSDTKYTFRHGTDVLPVPSGHIPLPTTGSLYTPPPARRRLWSPAECNFDMQLRRMDGEGSSAQQKQWKEAMPSGAGRPAGRRRCASPRLTHTSDHTQASRPYRPRSLPFSHSPRIRQRNVSDVPLTNQLTLHDRPGKVSRTETGRDLHSGRRDVPLLTSDKRIIRHNVQLVQQTKQREKLPEPANSKCVKTRQSWCWILIKSAARS